MTKSCPYRLEHEWDKDGLCKHCYASQNPAPVVAITEVAPDPWPLRGIISYTRGGKEFAFWENGRRHEHSQGKPCNLDCDPIQPWTKP